MEASLSLDPFILISGCVLTSALGPGENKGNWNKLMSRLVGGYSKPSIISYEP